MEAPCLAPRPDNESGHLYAPSCPRDVLLRLNLGWGEPGTDSATQLAGERTLLLTALGRL